MSSSSVGLCDEPCVKSPRLMLVMWTRCPSHLFSFFLLEISSFHRSAPQLGRWIIKLRKQSKRYSSGGSMITYYLFSICTIEKLYEPRHLCWICLLLSLFPCVCSLEHSAISQGSLFSVICVVCFLFAFWRLCPWHSWFNGCVLLYLQFPFDLSPFTVNEKQFDSYCVLNQGWNEAINLYRSVFCLVYLFFHFFLLLFFLLFFFLFLFLCFSCYCYCTFLFSSFSLIFCFLNFLFFLFLLLSLYPDSFQFLSCYLFL